MRHALTGNGRGFRLGAATALAIAHQTGEALVPILVGITIDRAIVAGEPGQLALWLGLLALDFLMLSLAYRGSARLMTRVYGTAENDLRQLTLARVVHPLGVHSRRGPGELLSVTTSDTYRVAGVSWSVVQQAATLTAITVSAVSLLLISVPLGLGVFAATALILVVMHAAAKPLEHRGLAEQRSAGQASAVATDLVEGLRILSGIRAQAEASRRYRAASRASRDGAIASSRLILRYQALSTVIAALFLAGLVFAAGWLAVRGDLSIGELVTVIGLAQFLQDAVAHVGTFGSNWMHKRASAKRLLEVLEESYAVPVDAGQPGVADPDQGSPRPHALVWRPDPSEYAAEIRVSAGSLVGIVPAGPAHAREISARLGYRAELGADELTLDGVPATQLGPEATRAKLLAPPHDAVLFSGPLHEAIGGRPEHPHVVRASALGDVIEHVGGWEAALGENGRRLSGGQRQRVLLARALNAPASVLVLDEPATAVDPATEERIAAGLREAPGTVIVITASPLLLAACHEVHRLAPREDRP